MKDGIVIGIALSGILLGVARASVLGDRRLPVLHAGASALLAFGLLPVVVRLPAEAIVAFVASPVALHVVGAVLVVEALALIMLAPSLIVAARRGSTTLRAVVAAAVPSPGAVLGLVLACSLGIRNNHTLGFGTLAAAVSLAGFLVVTSLAFGAQLVVRTSAGREGLLLLAALMQLLAGTFLPVLVASAPPTNVLLEPDLVPSAAVIGGSAAIILVGARLPCLKRRWQRP